MDVNGICVRFASKLSQKALIVDTIAVMLNLSKFAKYYKHTVREVACGG
jgi:hypothetical protein